jgi:hypothetical protein
MSKIRIVGAIASANGITFYLENGEELNRPKDTAQTRLILDQTVEALARHEIVELDLDDYSVERRIEERTGGAIRFLKTTAKRFKSLMGMGNASDAVLIGRLERLAAKPAPAPTAEVVKKEEEVTIAVVKTATGEVAIPHIQQIDKQLEHAAFENVVGFQRFMDRIAAVASQRKHTVDELLNFMKMGDLPIAEDGSIVAYKMLYNMGDHYVDPHTRKVKQKLGSHVSMPIDIVDDSRRHECSTGLHIARRGYIKSFNGDAIMVVKVAPEDVIAVPHNEPNKMRAAAYHIVAEVPKEGFDLLKANRPMTSHEASSRLLADVIAGQHPKVLEYVRINGTMGQDVVITPAEGTTFEKIMTTGKLAKALDEGVNVVSLKSIRDRAEAAIVAQKEVETRTEVTKPTVVQSAAASGDYGAAINAAATAAPTKAESPKAASSPAPTKAAKPTRAKAAETDLTDKNDAYIDAAPAEAPKIDKKAEALRLHGEGKSNRQIEAELHICRKTLKKLFDKNGLKPNG